MIFYDFFFLCTYIDFKLGFFIDIQLENRAKLVGRTIRAIPYVIYVEIR